MNKQLDILMFGIDAATARLIADRLSKAGVLFTTRHVETRVAFLIALQESAPDLLLTGHSQSLLDTMAALVMAHEICPEVPGILLMGNPGERLVIDSFKRGITNYVPRDQLHNLVPVLQRVLRQASEQAESKHVKQVLHAGEERYRLLTHDSMEPMCIFDPQTKTLLETNGAFRDLLGLTPDEVETQTLYDFIAQDRQEIDDRVLDILATEIHHSEWVWRHRDGQLKTVRATALRIPRRDQATIFVLARDITDMRPAAPSQMDTTEQTPAREARHFELALFRGMFTESSTGIIFSDKVGQLIEMNPAFERMLGYSMEEVHRLGVTGITHPADIVADAHLFLEVLAGKRDRYEIEKRYFHKDGRVIWANLTAFVVRDAQAQIQYVVGLLEDITQRKQTEEVVQRSKEHFQSLLQEAGDIIAGLAEYGLMTQTGSATAQTDVIQPEPLASAAADTADDGDRQPALAQVTGEVQARLKELEARLQALVDNLAKVSQLRGFETQSPRPDAARLLQKLSGREAEILHNLLADQRVPVIAGNLCISEHTVRSHLKSVFRKLGVHSQAELLNFLYKTESTATPERQ